MATKYKIFNGLTLSVCKCPPNPTAKPLWATRSRQCNLKHLCMKQTKEKYRQSRLAILRKIKREAKQSQLTSQRNLLHILFCPTHPSPPTTRQTSIGQNVRTLSEQKPKLMALIITFEQLKIRTCDFGVSQLQ